MKKLVVLGLVIFFGLLGVVSADHVVSPSSLSVTEDSIESFSFSVDNTGAVNITDVDITLPGSCSLDDGSESTTATGTFSGSGSLFSWSGAGLISAGNEEDFSFDATCSSAGDYTITISTTDVNGTVDNEIDLEVEEVSLDNPVAEFVSPKEDYATDDDSVTFEFKCYDNSGVNVIRLYTNANEDDEWKEEFENSSYENDTENQFSVKNIFQGHYKWAVFCSDSSGNVDWTTNRTFYITGGGTTNQTFYWDYSFSILSSQLEKGYTNSFLAKRRVLFYYVGDYHHVGIAEIKNTSIIVDVASDSVRAELSVGDTIYFNLNNDSVYDLSVTLNAINPSGPRAEITVATFNGTVEDIPEGDIVGGADNESEEQSEEGGTLHETSNESALDSEETQGLEDSSLAEEGTSMMTWIIVGVLSLIIIVIAIIFYKKANKSEEVSGEVQ